MCLDDCETEYIPSLASEGLPVNSLRENFHQSKIGLAAVQNGRPKSGTTIFEIMSAGIVTQIYGKLDLFWFPVFGNSMWCNDDRTKWADGCQNGPS